MKRDLLQYLCNIAEKFVSILDTIIYVLYYFTTKKDSTPEPARTIA